MFRCKHHTDRTRREVLDFAPMHGRNIESVVGAIQRILGTSLAVIQNHIETATGGNNQLAEVPVSVAATGGAAGNVR